MLGYIGVNSKWNQPYFHSLLAGREALVHAPVASHQLFFKAKYSTQINRNRRSRPRHAGHGTTLTREPAGYWHYDTNGQLSFLPGPSCLKPTGFVQETGFTGDFPPKKTGFGLNTITLRSGKVYIRRVLSNIGDSALLSSCVCPVCLCPPKAATATTCGHLFCWGCLRGANLADTRP